MPGRPRSQRTTSGLKSIAACNAAGPLIQYWRDDKKLFEMNDPQPYTSGHFALRTVHSHVEIRHFRVYRASEANP